MPKHKTMDNGYFVFSVTAATDKTQLTVLVGQTLIMECQLQNPSKSQPMQSSRVDDVE